MSHVIADKPLFNNHCPSLSTSSIPVLPTRRLSGGGDRVEQFPRLAGFRADGDRLAGRVDAHPACAAHHLLVARAGEHLPLREARVADERRRRADDDAARRQVHASAQSARRHQHSQRVLPEAALDYLALLNCQACGEGRDCSVFSSRNGRCFECSPPHSRRALHQISTVSRVSSTSTMRRRPDSTSTPTN